MKAWLQRKFIGWLVHDLFNTIDAEDILNVRSDRSVVLQGRELNEETRKNLILDARTFRDSVLWDILQREAKYHANRRIYEKSQTVEDIMAGKLLLYLNDVYDTVLKKLANL